MRRPLAIFALAALLALAAAAVAAGKLATPPTGAWKAGDAGGFTIAKQGSKLFFTGFHLTSPPLEACESKEATLRLVGKFPLKTFSRGGYTAWGVGKNQGGEPVDMPAKVEFAGGVHTGAFHVVFNYENPREALGGSIGFGSCRAEFAFAKPK